MEEIAAMPRTVTRLGYVNCQVEPGVWEVEHRLVMTAKLGRALRENENVHHVNGQRDDNRQKNLEVWDKPHPAGQRATGRKRKCPFCGHLF